MPSEKEKKNVYQKALDEYSQAVKTLRQGDYQKAVEQLKDFIKKHGSEEEMVDRALIYIEIAQNSLDKKAVPLKTVDEFYQNGVYRLNTGEPKEAVKLFEKALEKDPKSGRAHFLLASAYCQLKEEDNCLDHLNKAVKLDPSYKTLAQNEAVFEPLREDKKFNLITKLT